MKKLTENISFNLNLINSRIDKIEENILRLEELQKDEIALLRSHLLRLKHGENFNDDLIIHNRKYRDLTPKQAYSLYSDRNKNFILLDVSDPLYSKPYHFHEAIEMPLCDIKRRSKYELNKINPILVISENGTKSILACEALAELGHYNVNNISGGYKFWPGTQMQTKSIKAA